MPISHRHSDTSTIHALLGDSMQAAVWAGACVQPRVEVVAGLDLASDQPVWVQESHNLTMIRAGR